MQALRHAGKGKELVAAMIMERPLAERIAREQQSATRAIPHGERIVADDAVEKGFLPALESRKKDCCVAEARACDAGIPNVSINSSRLSKRTSATSTKWPSPPMSGWARQHCGVMPGLAREHCHRRVRVHRFIPSDAGIRMHPHPQQRRCLAPRRSRTALAYYGRADPAFAN